ncbi:DUF6934 family protein [Persicitalea jodogahamensis]|uniref:Uncharacterized protein n=1 Tax=Persicitalea jodogahamensis TaxID=402147 RepID=A0A8J3D2B5_9BACT|nr:hypothetical protein [Persicitalea jodogahamensis]GHB59619.1 hypothetical protein GCM10007390_11620 [Persicitalea jodogahamensis]
MNQPKYLYKSEEFLRTFEFTSEGNRGRIRKMVQYTDTGTENIYNLAFGDYDEETQEINDLSITNNGDSLKVLATVASTIYAFTEKYPEAWIFATGSTAVRTRLYRMGITNNLAEICKDFKVFGLTVSENSWEQFIIGDDYEAFLITRLENT